MKYQLFYDSGSILTLDKFGDCIEQLCDFKRFTSTRRSCRRWTSSRPSSRLASSSPFSDICQKNSESTLSTSQKVDKVGMSKAHNDTQYKGSTIVIYDSSVLMPLLRLYRKWWFRIVERLQITVKNFVNKYFSRWQDFNCQMVKRPLS